MKDGLRAEKRAWLGKVVEELDFTQREIAEKMGEREGNLSDRIHGRRGIPDYWVDAFEKEFGVTFKKKVSEPAQDAPINAREERLLSIMQNQAETIRQLVSQLEAKNAELAQANYKLAQQGVQPEGVTLKTGN